MKKLYFIRHGQSQLNAEHLFGGRTDTPLTKLGRAQAKAAAQSAKHLKIDAIVSSPLSRALETARIIAKSIGYPLEKIHISSLLIERDFGALEAQPWSPDLDLDGIADIETLESVLERAKLAVEWLQNLDAENILVVGHGAIGRAIRSHFLPDYPFTNRSAGGTKYDLPNAEIVHWLGNE